MSTLNWKKKEGDLEVNVPIQMWEGEEGKGNYEIYIGKRPHYCDRGDWIIYIEGRNDLDASDGFPRYFFGNEEEAKEQMETWLSRRSVYGYQQAISKRPNLGILLKKPRKGESDATIPM